MKKLLSVVIRAAFPLFVARFRTWALKKLGVDPLAE